MTHEHEGSWHVLSGEYPPVRGGVSDYSALVAEGLSELGWEVHAWAPGVPATLRNGVNVHTLPGRFDGRACSALASGLDAAPAPRHLLVQYVPQALGDRGVNLAFGHWLASRRDRGDVVHLMLHEPYIPYGGGLKRRAAAVATRMMAWSFMRGADRLYVSTPRWARLLRPFAPPGARFEWLPIPSTIPLAEAPVARDDTTPVVGHFGTYGTLVTRLLEPALHALLAAHDTVRVVLVGSGATAFAQRFQELRVQSSDASSPAEVAAAIAGSDLMLQPYADGVSARRTTTMAALVNSVAVVTNSGETTEPEWSSSGAALLVDGSASALAQGVLALLKDPSVRTRIGAAGHRLYDARFALRHTLATLTREAAT